MASVNPTQLQFEGQLLYEYDYRYIFMIFINEYGRCTYVLVCCTQLSAVPCESVRVWYSAERNQVCAMQKIATVLSCSDQLWVAAYVGVVA